MNVSSRIVPLLGCVAFAGCCAAPKTQMACATCAPSLSCADQVPSTYENYSPPPAVLKPIPSQDAVPSPPAEAALLPPSRVVPDPAFDFFESADSQSKK
jgi:hypothetical protein